MIKKKNNAATPQLPFRLQRPVATTQLAKTQPAASAGLHRGFLQPQEPLSGTNAHFHKHTCQTMLRFLSPVPPKNKKNSISAILPWCREAEGLKLPSPKDGAHGGTADGLCWGCKPARVSVTAVFISLYYALNPCGETGAELPAKQQLATHTSNAPHGCREATCADAGLGHILPPVSASSHRGWAGGTHRSSLGRRGSLLQRKSLPDTEQALYIPPVVLRELPIFLRGHFAPPLGGSLKKTPLKSWSHSTLQPTQRPKRPTARWPGVVLYHLQLVYHLHPLLLLQAGAEVYQDQRGNSPVLCSQRCCSGTEQHLANAHHLRTCLVFLERRGKALG